MLAHPEEVELEEKQQKERDEDIEFYKKIIKQNPIEIITHIQALELKLSAFKDALQKNH